MNAPVAVQSMLVAPSADIAEMHRTLSVLFEPGDVIELRAIFQRGRKRVDAGYFDPGHRNDLVREALRLNNAGASVYVVMNALDPQLLSRYANRMQEFAQATAADANVIRRRWLLLDFDPVRPKDTSSSDEQLESAGKVARHCRDALAAQGWPMPVTALSGNGVHLLYPIDLPNDARSDELVKRALDGLALRFDTDKVKLDRSVFNSARITKLYGSVANKGDNLPAAPWRASRLFGKQIPARKAVVTVEQLRAVIPRDTPAQSAVARGVASGQPFDVEEFLARSGIEYTSGEHNDAMRYLLAHCPFNAEHGRGEAAVFQYPNGALSFRCMHNGCADKRWQDFRELVDGPREARRMQSALSPSKADGWPAPLPPPELPTVAPFAFELLPGVLQPWAHDICERVQCPPDYVGVTVMAALGSVIGRKVGIRPQARTDWTEISNQWALLIGRPGVLKSPAMEAALAPLKLLAAKAAQAHQTEMQKHQQKARLAKLKAEAGEKAARVKLAKDRQADVSGELAGEDAAEEPTLKRYIANDSTAAALGELLRQNQNGLLVFRDELVSLLKGLDREDNAEARGFYLTGWAGNSAYTFDRIGRGLNLYIPAVCLSLLGSTQPGRIAEYLRAAVKGGVGDDGLMQRFGLLVWPDTGGEWRDVDRWPDSEARRRADAVFARFDSLDPLGIGASKGEFDDVPHLRFDDEGLGLFRDWREGWERKLRSGDLHPALESHLAKYRKLVPGLALILHLADAAPGAVGKRATLQALAWAEYLETHARRAYASVTAPAVTAAKALLEKLHRGELTRTFAARDIYRKQWAHLSDREQVYDAIRLLDDLGWLLPRTVETAGRAATVYDANPRGLES